MYDLSYNKLIDMSGDLIILDEKHHHSPKKLIKS